MPQRTDDYDNREIQAKDKKEKKTMMKINVIMIVGPRCFPCLICLRRMIGMSTYSLDDKSTISYCFFQILAVQDTCNGKAIELMLQKVLSFLLCLCVLMQSISKGIDKNLQ